MTPLIDKHYVYPTAKSPSPKIWRKKVLLRAYEADLLYKQGKITQEELIRLHEDAMLNTDGGPIRMADS